MSHSTLKEVLNNSNIFSKARWLWGRYRSQLLIAVVVAVVLLLALLGGEQFFNPEFYRQAHQQYPVGSALLFFVIYVAVTAVSFPGAAILTVVAGAIFGFWQGLFLVSFASSLGATIAFLVSRWLLRDWVQNTFSSHLGTINRGMEKEGAFYLFSLRLIPLVPFFVINLVMGLTRLRTRTFYWVSQLGMLPGTMLYVNAGSELGALESLSVSDLMTPGIVFSLVLLAIFPFLAKGLVAFFQQRTLYKNYAGVHSRPKPTTFDNNLVVIGAGSGGLVSAYIAAAAKAKVTLIEKSAMGGDCLNTGCVPSKALLRAAKAVQDTKTMDQLGLSAGEVMVDFAAVMSRVKRVIADVAPHDSIERYEKLGVHCITGEASLLSPWEVAVNGQVITTKNIIIATGARPRLPAIDGMEHIHPLTSDTIWGLTALPKTLLIVGGGPIGCEMAQAFQRLGSQVILVEKHSRLLARADAEAAEQVQQQLMEEGVLVFTDHQISRFAKQDGVLLATLSSISDQHEQTQAFDQVLFAVGRQANTDGLGLEALGIGCNANGTIDVDDQLRTRFPNILACGDVVGPYQLTHSAAHQAWYAAVNGLFRGIKSFTVDYRTLPSVVFTDPEVAQVGLTEYEAQQQGIAYETTRYGIDDQDRAIVDGHAAGFIKVLTAPGKDRILGVTIVGHQAGELLAEFTLAMKHGLGLRKILSTIHSYPTLSEANKYVAGNWQREHSPAFVLRWAEKFHRWRRHQ